MTSFSKETGVLAQIQSGVVPWTAIAAVVAAVLLGIFMIYGVGFAGSEVIHNLAHDARHGLSFPCH